MLRYDLLSILVQLIERSVQDATKAVDSSR